MKKSQPNTCVSVCLAVRNEESYVRDTLRCIQAQTHENIEVLIFDNDSSDRTPDICQEFSRSDARFTLYRNRHDIGQVANFNRCVSAASADFVAIQSGNDLIEPEYLEKTLAILKENPDTGIAYTRCLRIDANSNLVDHTYPDKSFFATTFTDPVDAAISVIKYFTHTAPYFAVYRRSLLDRLQPIRHVFGGDKIFICEAALYADIEYVPEPLFLERKHPRQATLREIFSEDFVYQVPVRSYFSKLDGLTPFANMICGFIDMFSRARIAEPEKIPLCKNSHAALVYRYKVDLQQEKEKALDLIDRIREMVAPERGKFSSHLVLRNSLNCLNRMMLVLPRDKELRELAGKVVDLL